VGFILWSARTRGLSSSKAIWRTDSLCKRHPAASFSRQLSRTFKLFRFTAIPKLLIRPLARPARVPRGCAVVPDPEEAMASCAGQCMVVTRESEMMLDEVFRLQYTTNCGRRATRVTRRGRLCAITTGHDSTVVPNT